MAVLADTRLPIAQLNPSIDTAVASIHGIVTIVWPYSSLQQTTSILLAEPDFRLRQQKGQIRITFRGSSAKAVARSGLTSGDRIILYLEGATWLGNGLSTGTPGRAVDWELSYGRRLRLEVRTHILCKVDFYANYVVESKFIRTADANYCQSHKS